MALRLYTMSSEGFKVYLKVFVSKVFFKALRNDSTELE